MKPQTFAVTCMLLLAACSSGDDQGSRGGGDHVWKEQVATIDKAKEAEKAMADAAAKQAEALQQQTE